VSEKYKFKNPDGIYFISPTVTAWVDLFSMNCYREILIDSLIYCCTHKGLVIHGWCFMTNHMHMIISRKGSDDLGSIIRDFKKHTNRSLIELIKTAPESRKAWMLKIFEEEAERIKRVKGYKLWQDGNHPIELISNQIIDQKLDYVHRNPVEAGFVQNPEDYIYSSARDYSGEKGILPLVKI